MPFLVRLEPGMIFEGTKGLYECIYIFLHRLNFQVSKKKKKYANSKFLIHLHLRTAYICGFKLYSREHICTFCFISTVCRLLKFSRPTVKFCL